MVKLSQRMKAVAAMVTPGHVLCDVGTDHGYVPIALIQKQLIPRAIAMDINPGPLERAKEHIGLYELGEYIETRLSDGVAALQEGEAESIVVAGMGGELVIHILTEGEAICRKAKELILQPQSDIWKVRRFLRENKYQIVDEDMVFEEGKYYPMMKVVPVEKDEMWDRIREDYIMPCDIYGPLLLRNGNPVLRRFLVNQHKQFASILQGLEKQEPSEAILKRMEEVKQQLAYNESAYCILGEMINAGI